MKGVFPVIKVRLCLPALLFKNMFKCNICKNEIWLHIETLKSLPNLKMNSPMLTTQIWKQCLNFYSLDYKQKHLFLCDDCMKVALGREFQSEDFRDCPLPSDYIKQKNLNITIIKRNDMPRG